MRHRNHRPWIAVITAALVLLSAPAVANMYRYKDAQGQIVIGNTIPQSAVKRGYDVLNSSGRVIRTVDPALTPEEIAAREARKEREKQRQAAEARQREQDEKLLERFSHPDDAVRAMYRKIRELKGLTQLKRGNISVIVNQLDTEQSRAADRERSGRSVQDATLQKIQRMESQIRDIEREIRSQDAEIETLKEQFIEDVERLETLTGEKRTLPLELPEENNSNS